MKTTQYRFQYIVACAIICVLVAVLLSGCAGVTTLNAGVADATPIGKWLNADADAALALAQSTGDTAAIPCWTQVKASIAAVGGAKGEVGILFADEFSRAVKIEQAKVNAACSPAGIVL